MRHIIRRGHESRVETLLNIKIRLQKPASSLNCLAVSNQNRKTKPFAGLPELRVVAETGSQPVNSPDDWWAMILGSGYRGTVEQLSVEDRERVRVEDFAFIQRASVRSVEANVVYAVG